VQFACPKADLKVRLYVEAANRRATLARMTVHARSVPGARRTQGTFGIAVAAFTASVEYSAFYFQPAEGVVTDPALMVIPFDDHIVHRGTASSIRRDRRRKDLRPGGAPRSLSAVGRAIEAALPGSRAEMTDIIVQTRGGSGRRDRVDSLLALVRPGSLELTPARGAEPGFFVMIFAGSRIPSGGTRRVAVMTTTYPIKAPSTPSPKQRTTFRTY
jgi:hypothetical protein